MCDKLIKDDKLKNKYGDLLKEHKKYVISTEKNHKELKKAHDKHKYERRAEKLAWSDAKRSNKKEITHLKQ